MSIGRSGRLFWTLVRLRYQLIWAQARRSPGRVVMLILVSLVFAVLALIIGTVGLGAAVAGAHLGRVEAITRGVLSAFHISAVMTSLFFGLGPRAAFSEHALRRFPLTSKERVIFRHLIGLIDPIWFLLGTSAFGIAVGLAITGTGSLTAGLEAAALYVLAAYLSAVFLLSLVDRLMQSPAGAAAISILGVAALSFSGLGITWLLSPEHPARVAVVDQGLRYAPSGLAASMMMGGSLVNELASLALLLLWSAFLLGLVGWLEQRKSSRGAPLVSTSVGTDFDTPYDRLSSILGAAYGPLAGKALRYYLRSNRVRLGLASAPIFAFIGRFMSQQNGTLGGIEFYFTLAFFSFLGFSGTSWIALNQFGSDGEGVYRYAVLPVRFESPVRAGSLISMLLGVVVLAPTVGLWTLVTRTEVEWRMVAMLCGSSLGGLFFFSGLAMWTTLLSPKRVEYASMLNNRLPLGGNLVVGGGLVLVFALNFVLMRMRLESVLVYWWTFLVFAITGLIFYIACWWGIGRVAETRRNRVIDAIAS